MFIIIIIAFAAGLTNVIARNINSLLADKIGLLEGTFFNYITGLMLSLIVLLFTGEFLKISSLISKPIPLYAYLGGLIGVVVVTLSNLVTPKISSFYLTILTFIGQLFTGILIDYFSNGLISIGKLIGGTLVVLGLTYNLMVDKKNES